MSKNKAVEFLTALGFDLDQEEPGLELRILGKGNPQSLWPGKGRKTWPQARALNAEGYNIFFGVCPRRDHGKKKKDVVLARSAWVDLDGCTFDQADPVGRGKAMARERLSGAALAPSIVVDSGRGLHCYWLLQDPIEFTGEAEIQRFERLLRSIAVRLGGDVHCADVARILRMPQTNNVKDPSKPLPCLVESINPGRRYTLEQLEDAFPPGEEEAGSGTSGDAESKPSANWLRFIDPECIEEIREGDREPTLRKIASALVNQTNDVDVIETHLKLINERCCRPPRDEATCKRLAEQVVRLYGEEAKAAEAKANLDAVRARVEKEVVRIEHEEKKSGAEQLAAALVANSVAIEDLLRLHEADFGGFNRALIRIGTKVKAGTLSLLRATIRKAGGKPSGGGEDDHGDGHDGGGGMGAGGNGTGPIILPDDPMGQARIVLSRMRPNLLHDAGDWVDWEAGAYKEIPDDILDSEVWRLLEDARVRRQTPVGPVVSRFKPSITPMSNLMKGLKSLAERTDPAPAPCWMDGTIGPPPREMISCANGLLHIPTGELLPATPKFFTRNAIDVAYDPAAPEPELWLKTLKEWWPRDEEADCVTTLQEMFGYLIDTDKSQEKAFLIIGRPRSGKGTIAHIISDLVGRRNVVSPRLQAFSGDFGLQPLLGKSLAIISDMRIGSRDDKSSIAENLLKLSSRDSVSVGRKNKTNLNVDLPTRFLMLTNPIPSWSDPSGTIAKRLVVLKMDRSYYGREDRMLKDKLQMELQGILNWSLEGWRRLRDRGHFVQPASGQYIIDTMYLMSNPIAQFVAERCILGAEREIHKDALYSAYTGWHTGTFRNDKWRGKNEFLEALFSAHPEIRPTRPCGDDGKSIPVLAGIALDGPPSPDYGPRAGEGADGHL